jgi:pimeloyl-ACP methyl ester carboxylesterase
MQHQNHVLIGSAASIPSRTPVPIASISPLGLSVSSRPVLLALRATFPVTISRPLPVILLSHGHGLSNWLSSLKGYAPLYEHLASQGFVVLQPTHLSSKSLGLSSQPGQELHWTSRPRDMSNILDQLDAIEAAVPQLQGKLDRANVGVIGHSLGGLTASQLLGCTNKDPRDPEGKVLDLTEPRIRAGVILAGTGKGGEDLSEMGRTALVPFYGPDFSTMRTPTLVVYGDEDVGPHLTVRDATWHADPYMLAPGSKDLLTVKGGKHGLGGISGWDVAETLDESPQMLTMVLRMISAYFRSQLLERDQSWNEAIEALKGLPELGAVESKGN